MEEKTERIDDEEMFQGYLIFMKFIERPEELTEKERKKLRSMGIKL